MVNNWKMRLKALLKSMKFTTPVNETQRAFVYINKPIEHPDEDLIDFSVQVKSIKEAIDAGANSIGVISDYGTGKSSLTELICIDDNKYCRPIKISLWDSLPNIKTECGDDIKQKGITTLTKSFLFQMASGSKQKNFAKHINKKLSKNFGLISISNYSKGFWLWLMGAALMYGLFDFSRSLSLDWFISPTLLVFSLFFAILGIKNSNIAFSLWDSQGKREPEINDVFEVFLEISHKLYKENRKKKQIIIIEDLDRTSEKIPVVDFLKEIYRFNNLIHSNSLSNSNFADHFVFIVAVKPEHMLDKSDPDEVYPKIFDYTIPLKPIHTEDYKSIVLKLIEKEKETIGGVIGMHIDGDNLPDDFEWILVGTNLTVRDLKQRLNQGLLLYRTLKNKKNGTGAVNLRRCMAVSYLENAFSEDFYFLLHNELAFSEVIEKTYMLNNSNEHLTDNERQQRICEIIKVEYSAESTDKKMSDSFVKATSEMLASNIIDGDFRMYFYSYPKGSPVKNTEEKALANLIINPTAESAPKDLDRIVETVGNSADDVIIEGLRSRVNRGLPLPNIIFEQEKIFSLASNKHLNETVTLMLTELKWQTKDIARSKAVFQQINAYDVQNKDDLLNLYGKKVMTEQLLSLESSSICAMRLALIEALSENIIHCKDIFLGDKMPLISQPEISSSAISVTTKLQLINPSLFTDESMTYIFDVVNEEYLSGTDYSSARNLLNNAPELISDTTYSLTSLNLLSANNKVSKGDFDEIVVSYHTNGVPSKSDILMYVGQLKVSELTEEYFVHIDSLMAEENVSNELLSCLKNSELYHTYLLCLIKQDRLAEVDFENQKVTEQILAALVKINEFDPTKTCSIRSFLIAHKRTILQNYFALFFGAYPLITVDELNLLDSYADGVTYFDLSKVISPIVARRLADFINAQKMSEDDLSKFLGLFYETITDSEVVQELYSALDFQRLNFKALPTVTIEEWVSKINATLNLVQPNLCLEFMRKIGVLVVSLEQVVLSGISSRIIDSDEYFALVNQINHPTQQTLINIYSLNPNCGFAHKITDAFYDDEHYLEYVIGRTLWEERFEFESEKIPFDVYFNLYVQNDTIFVYMSKDISFLMDIIKNQKFNDFSVSIQPNRIEALYPCEQTIEFAKFVFERLSQPQVREYLIFNNRFNSKEDSSAFVEFILRSENNFYLESAVDFEAIYIKIWEEPPQLKGAFRRKRNDLYPKPTPLAQELL